MRFGLVGRLFDCWLRSLGDFLLGRNFGIGRGGNFGFDFYRCLNNDFNLHFRLRSGLDLNNRLRLGTFNVLGAHGLEVLLAALFLLVGLLGTLGGLGLVFTLGKGRIPSFVGDDGGIQATTLKDGQLNAVVELLEQFARGLKTQVASSHIAGGERFFDLCHKRLLAASNCVAQQAIQIDVVAQRKRGLNYCLAHGKSPLYTRRASYHRPGFAMTAPKANGREP